MVIVHRFEKVISIRKTSPFFAILKNCVFCRPEDFEGREDIFRGSKIPFPAPTERKIMGNSLEKRTQKFSRPCHKMGQKLNKIFNFSSVMCRRVTVGSGGQIGVRRRGNMLNKVQGDPFKMSTSQNLTNKNS